MAEQLSTVRRMFDSCWFELTSLDMANHGPTVTALVLNCTS
jgi:hypothetical protein